MALDLGRWIRYAQAKVNDVVRSSDEELARREAARELETADKPWLADDTTVPNLETARARIAWESEQAAATSGHDDAEEGPGEVTAEEGSVSADTSTDTDLGRFGTDAAEAAQARVELDQRAEESAARLEAIRRELGVAPPDDGEA